ncbi:thioredoxin [soil metagenome]
MSEKITKITDSDFDSHVITASGKMSLVLFSATWSGQTRMIRPILEGTLEKYQSKISFYDLDIDENSATAMKYLVKTAPTLIIFRNGQIVDTIVGLTNRDKLNKVLEKATEPSEMYKNMVAFTKKFANGIGKRFGV